MTHLFMLIAPSSTFLLPSSFYSRINIVLFYFICLDERINFALHSEGSGRNDGDDIVEKINNHLYGNASNEFHVYFFI